MGDMRFPRNMFIQDYAKDPYKEVNFDWFLWVPKIPSCEPELHASRSGWKVTLGDMLLFMIYVFTYFPLFICLRNLRHSENLGLAAGS